MKQPNVNVLNYSNVERECEQPVWALDFSRMWKGRSGHHQDRKVLAWIRGVTARFRAADGRLQEESSAVEI